jgi:hypothetical protein
MRPDRSASANKRVASKIAPRLYLTCLATAKDVAQLADLGITHVVSVIEDAPKFPSTYPLHTLHISVSDYDGEDILSHLPTTTSFIRGALAESPKNRVLVRTYVWLVCKDAPANTITYHITTGPLLHGHQPKYDGCDRLPYRHHQNDAARGAHFSPVKADDRAPQSRLHVPTARVLLEMFRLFTSRAWLRRAAGY